MTMTWYLTTALLTCITVQAAAAKAPSVSAGTAKTATAAPEETAEPPEAPSQQLAADRVEAEDDDSVDLDISDEEGGLEAGAEGQGSDVDEDWADWN